MMDLDKLYQRIINEQPPEIPIIPTGVDKEITLKDIEDDYEAFCSFDRHDPRIGWLIKRIKDLEKEG